MKALYYTIANLIINIFLVILKIIAGIIFNSAALISDGIHSFSDFLTDTLSFFSIKKSYEPADKEHPFGHGKYEYIGSLITSIILLFVSYELVKEIILKEEIIRPNILGSFIVIITIIIKIIMATILIKKGKEYDNSSLLANGYEGISDTLTSIIALFGILLSQFNYEWIKYADIVASLIIILIIVRTGLKVLFLSINLLLGVEVTSEVKEKYEEIILKSHPEIKGIHKMIVLKYGPAHHIIVDILVDSTMDVEGGHDIGKIVKENLLKEKKVSYVKIHLEPYKKD